MDSIVDIAHRSSGRFETMRQEVLDAGTDNLGHFGNGYVVEGNYSLQQNPDEFAGAVLRLQELGLSGGKYLEIGSASGGACRFIQERIGFRRLFAIDDRSHARWKEQIANFETMKIKPELFIGDSHSREASEWVARCGRVELAFIDGDHSYDGCLADFRMMRPFTRYVMFHDIIACDGVKRVWDESISAGTITPLCALVGGERPLGIGIGRIR